MATPSSYQSSTEDQQRNPEILIPVVYKMQSLIDAMKKIRQATQELDDLIREHSKVFSHGEIESSEVCGGIQHEPAD